MIDEDNKELERGYHITLDAFSRSPEALKDKDYIDRVLCEAIKEIDMKLIDGPHSIWYTDCAPEAIGVTSVAILAESSISIHTYPVTSYLALDIFSCNPFDEDALIKFFKEKLHINLYHINRIARGSQVI